MKRSINKLSKLGFERLEDRRMMAFVDVDAQGDLFIDCRSDGRKNDIVEVNSVGNTWEVYLNGNYYNIPKSRVGSYIECYLGDGDDYFANWTSLMADVEGGAGNDHLIGGSGNDGFDGGSGIDTLEGRDGNDYIFGGADKDWIYGGIGNDTLDGYTGDDYIWGWYGNDTLYGSHGTDQLFGEFDNDTLYGESGNDWLYGGWGNDYAHRGTEVDTISGEGGDDTLDGYTGDDWVYGGYGNDTLYGSHGNDKLYGDWDNDTLYGEGGYDTLDCGSGDDYAHGGTENDTIRGGLDNDTLDGYTGNDTLYGSYGNDTLLGSTGDDKLYGEYGNDSLHGEAGNDLLDGFSGDDTYFFDADIALGSDTVYDSQGGIDTLDFSQTTSRGVKVNLADRRQQAVNTNLRLTLRVDAAIENLIGGAGSDWLWGNALDNLLRGGAGNDLLYGDAGNDGLFGGANDGQDILNGGPGADRFLMPANLTSSSFYEDLVGDFAAEDARPTFLNGYTTSFLGAIYTPATWTNEDILRVDSALNVLHRETGNTRLLETAIGADLVIVRHGTTLRGFNDGWIHLTNSPLQFGGNDRLLRGYVLHEIGHNWNGNQLGTNSSGQSRWDEFQGRSGWQSLAVGLPVPSRFTRGVNEGTPQPWIYRTSSTEFASTYARSSPYEDWAESFAAYFTQQAGWTFYAGTGAAAIPTKITIIDQWVRTV